MSGNRPVLKGTINLKGEPYDVALWLGETKSGRTYVSGKIGDKLPPTTKTGKQQFCPNDSGHMMLWPGDNVSITVGEEAEGSEPAGGGSAAGTADDDLPF